MTKRQKIQVRVGTLDDLQKHVNNLFDNPQRIDDEPDHTIYLSPEHIPQILSKEKLRIIQEVRANNYTLGELARVLKRKQENISRDIKQLEQYGLIEVVKNGRQKHPTARPNIAIII